MLKVLGSGVVAPSENWFPTTERLASPFVPAATIMILAHIHFADSGEINGVRQCIAGAAVANPQLDDRSTGTSWQHRTQTGCFVNHDRTGAIKPGIFNEQSQVGDERAARVNRGDKSERGVLL